jgi:hypothetical protein
MTNTMHDAVLDMKIVVGPDEVELEKKKKQQLAQGVPVHVNPVLMTNTMHDAVLDMKIVVGPDEVELEKKKKQQLAQGVPVYVNPTKLPNEMGDASMDLPNIKVGGNEVSVLQKKQKLAQTEGVPVHVQPVLMTNTMHDAKLDMKIVVGPDEVELKKKTQQLVQKESKKSKYTEMKDNDLQALVKKQIADGAKKEEKKDDAKKGLDELKAVEDALGKRILDRLTGYGW